MCVYIYIYIYIYITGSLAKWVECSPMVRETCVHFQVHSSQRLLKWYLIHPWLTLSNIRYVSRVKRSNPGKGIAPSPTPRCSSYWKGSLLVALDYGRQLYLLYIYCNILFRVSFAARISRSSRHNFLLPLVVSWLLVRWYFVHWLTLCVIWNPCRWSLQRSLIQKIVIYEFKLGFNVTEATKLICCVKSEDTVGHSRVNKRFKIIYLVCKNIDDQASSGRYGFDSEAVLQAIEAKPVCSTRRVSGEHIVQCSSSLSRPRQKHPVLPNHDQNIAKL